MLALPLLFSTAHAIEFEPTPTSPYQTKASGIGWKLVTVPTANLGGVYSPPPSPLPREQMAITSGEYTTVYMIDSLTGLENSPLAASLKQDLAVEFSAPMMMKANSKKVGTSATSNQTFSTSGLTPVIFVHKGVADAIAAGNEQKIYGAFVQPEAVEQGIFGCGGKWYGKSKSGTFNPSNLDGAKNFNIGGGFSGSLGANVPMNGTVNYDFRYSYRANRCIGIPYAVRFDNLRTHGTLNFNNSQLSLDGAINYKYSWNSWNSNPIRLYNNSWTFFVGPIPVVLGLEVPLIYGIDVDAKVAGSISIAKTGNGAYVFDYTCTQSDCSGSNNSSVQFQNAKPGARSSVALEVNAKPYVSVEAIGYLYSKWFLSAGLGMEISAPSKFWAYSGNNCGDADGDGTTEHVKSAVLDVNAQLALYGKWQIVGRDSWSWMDWRFSVAGWEIFKVSDFTSGKADFYALRRNLYFKEFESAATSALTPIIVGPNNVAATGSGYSAMMRSCVPFKDKMKYAFEWGDGTSNTFEGSGAQQTFQAHNWASTGAKTIKLMAQSDAIKRDFANISTSRNIVVGAVAAPSTPGSISAPASSGTSLTVSWAAASGLVDRYELQQQFNGGAWSDVSTANVTSKAFTGLAMGWYNYRVRACNSNGCSAYTNSIAVNVVAGPAAPTASIFVEDLCFGENTASWNAVSGATQYQLFKSTTNSSATATLFSTVSDTYATFNVSRLTYVWVKACNGSACSGFSNTLTARYSRTAGCTCMMKSTTPAKSTTGAQSTTQALPCK